LVPALIRLGVIGAAVDALEHIHIPHITKRIEYITAKAAPLFTITFAPHITTIPQTIPKVGRIEKDLSNLWDRVKSLGKRGAVAVGVGALIAALAHVGLRWARCSKVGRTGEAICGMNEDLLLSLLADTLLIVGTIDLVAFAKGMQLVTRETVGPIAGFWNADKHGLAAAVTRKAL
jgi:hypothetical protein